MMVRLYDYEVSVADPAAGVPALPDVLATLEASDRKLLLTGLFKLENVPGTMERFSTLVPDVDVAFADLLVLLDNRQRARRFVAIDEAKAILDRCGLDERAVSRIREWDVARLLEPYGDGTYHGKLLKRTRKQLRSVSDRAALTTPFLYRREW